MPRDTEVSADGRSDELTNALIGYRTGVCSERDIESAVCALVDAAKDAGQPVERVIIAIKEIARTAGVPVSTYIYRSDAAVLNADGILARAVTWCIQHFYGISPTGSVGSANADAGALAMDLPHVVQMTMRVEHLFAEQLDRRATDSETALSARDTRAQLAQLSQARANALMYREFFRRAVQARVRKQLASSVAPRQIVEDVGIAVLSIAETVNEGSAGELLRVAAMGWADAEIHALA
ncbi:MAG TPA: hypothetical protein VGM82_13630 [Gemmatimonadaceae bacterium]|jgi:hypothetical protein